MSYSPAACHTNLTGRDLSHSSGFILGITYRNGDRSILISFLACNRTRNEKGISTQTPLDRSEILYRYLRSQQNIGTMDEKDSALCIRCNMIENTEHVWKCKHNSYKVIGDMGAVSYRVTRMMND